MSPTVFISYGNPDEAFAVALQISLKRAGLDVFLFKPDATAGMKLYRMMRDEINSRDYTILVCSKSSLQRPGVLNEIEECLQKEARIGGKAVLIPITLDSYVFSDWAPEYPGHAQAIRDRVIGDFQEVNVCGEQFALAVTKLLDSLHMDRFRPKAQALGGRYIVRIEDDQGHLSKLTYTRKFKPIVDDLDYLELPDLTAGGQITITGCNLGELREVLNEGGKKRLIFEPTSPLKRDHSYEMIVDMIGTDCYTESRESTSVYSRFPYPYLEIEVFLPESRPSLQACLTRILGPQKTVLPHEVVITRCHLFAHVDEPEVEATYLIEWVW